MNKLALSWQYLTLYADTIEVAVPGCQRSYFEHRHLTVAVSLRDKRCAQQGIALYGSRPPGNYTNRYDKEDQSLPPGISRDIRPIRNSNSISESLRCQCNGKTLSRSVNKYGEQGALALLLEWQAIEQEKIRARRDQDNNRKVVI